MGSSATQYERGDRVMMVTRLPQTGQVIRVRVGTVKKRGKTGVRVKWDNDGVTKWYQGSKIEPWDIATVRQLKSSGDGLDAALKGDDDALAIRSKAHTPAKREAPEPEPKVVAVLYDDNAEDDEEEEPPVEVLASADRDDLDAVVEAPIDSIEADIEALLDMRRPFVARLEKRLRSRGLERRTLQERHETAMRELREAFERDCAALTETYDEERVRLDDEIGRIEAGLDRLNADTGPTDAEIAKPRDPERVQRYKRFICTVLRNENGKATWNKIRLHVLEAHPDVDTRFLGSALNSLVQGGEVVKPSGRGGVYLLKEWGDAK